MRVLSGCQTSLETAIYKSEVTTLRTRCRFRNISRTSSLRASTTTMHYGLDEGSAYLGEAFRWMCANTCSIARGIIPRSSADAPLLNPSIVNVFPVPCVFHIGYGGGGTVGSTHRLLLVRRGWSLVGYGKCADKVVAT